MAPGVDELAQGRPFVGPSGRILARALIEAGISPDIPRYINAICCPPNAGLQETLRLRGQAFQNGKRIGKDQHAACAGRLQSELLALPNCKVIVLLGAEALAAVAGITKEATRWAGHPIVVSQGKAGSNCAVTLPPSTAYLLPLYHPAYVQYRGMRGEMAALKLGFMKVGEMLRGSYKPENFGELARQASWSALAKAPGPLAYDIENDPDGHITRIGFATRAGARVISASFPWGLQVLQNSKALLEESGRIKLAHNQAHDIKILAMSGINVAGPCRDTMWAHQLRQPEMPKSLDAVSAFWLEVPRWKHLSNENPELYNRLDAHYTLLCWEAISKSLAEVGLLEHFERVVSPALATLIRMTRTGLRVDQSAAKQWRKELETIKSDTEKELKRLTQNPKFNPRSHMQIKTFLYETLGLPQQFSDGKLTSDQSALEKLKRKSDHQFLQTLLDHRAAAKDLGTYAQLTGDRVHPSYFPIGKDGDRFGTATGRLSSQGPNIQNQPPEAKRLFIPDKGFVLVEADYSQIELRVMAWQSGDERLKELLLAKQDIHAANQAILGCDRTRAKNFIYGWAYGAGARKVKDTMIAKGIEVTEKEVKEMMARFQAAYPRLWAWRQELVAEATRLGYARNCFGRRRYFYRPDRCVPEILNFHPQSIVADIMLDRLPVIEATFEEFDGKILTTVHDSFLGQLPPANVRAALPRLQEALEIEYPMVGPGFRCPADFKVGRRNWAAMFKTPVRRGG